MSEHLWRDSFQYLGARGRYGWVRFWHKPSRLARKSNDTPKVFYPAALRVGDATAGRNWLAGDFTLGGGVAKNPLLNPFQIKSPSRQWTHSLMGFDWLKHLLACDTPAAKLHTRRMIQFWISTRSARPNAAWRGDVVARRLISWSMVLPWLSNTPFASLQNSESDKDEEDKTHPPLWDDDIFYARVYGAFHKQTRWLERSVFSTLHPLPRLMAGLGLAWARLKFDGAKAVSPYQDRLWQLIFRELDAQILQDGGHISRAPSVLLDIASDMLALYFVHRQYRQKPPDILSKTLGRIFPLLRFFLHGDGRFAMFHGGAPRQAQEISNILAHDRKQAPPFTFAPQSGYRRLSAGDSLVFLDAAPAAKHAFSLAAHSAPLALEMSDGKHRLIVNCGAGQFFARDWQRAMRAAAAHSCLSFDEASPATILQPKGWGFLLGERLVRGADNITAKQIENEGGGWLETSHNGYLGNQQTRIFRRLFLSDDGRDLRGEDMLVYEGRGKPPDLPFSLRFHLHPDVIAKIDNEKQCFSLTLPNGAEWVFSAVAPAKTKIMLDSSLYLGDKNAVRPARQLVLSGQLNRAKTQIRWALQKQEGQANATAKKD